MCSKKSRLNQLLRYLTPILLCEMDNKDKLFEKTNDILFLLRAFYCNRIEARDSAKKKRI